MAGHAGRTYGFGRVSTVTRPSPYSPVQFRGGSPFGAAAGESLPAQSRVAARRARRRKLRRAATVIVIFAAALGAGSLYWTMVRVPAPLPPPIATRLDAPVPPPVAKAAPTLPLSRAPAAKK